jgi:hypothetical protein
MATETATVSAMASGERATVDGRWATEQVGSRPFTTRFVMLRPRDTSLLNGVVVVNWQNVTAGVDLGRPSGRRHRASTGSR